MKLYHSRIDIDLSLHALMDEVSRLAQFSHLFNEQDRSVVQQCHIRLQQLTQCKQHDVAAPLAKVDKAHQEVKCVL